MRRMALVAIAFLLLACTSRPSFASEQFIGVVEGFAPDTVTVSTSVGDMLVPASAEFLVDGYAVPVGNLVVGSQVTVYVPTEEESLLVPAGESAFATYSGYESPSYADVYDDAGSYSDATYYDSNYGGDYDNGYAAYGQPYYYPPSFVGFLAPPPMYYPGYYPGYYGPSGEVSFAFGDVGLGFGFGGPSYYPGYYPGGFSSFSLGIGLGGGSFLSFNSFSPGFFGAYGFAPYPALYGGFYPMAYPVAVPAFFPTPYYAGFPYGYAPNTVAFSNGAFGASSTFANFVGRPGFRHDHFLSSGFPLANSGTPVLTGTSTTALRTADPGRMHMSSSARVAMAPLAHHTGALHSVSMPHLAPTLAGAGAGVATAHAFRSSAALNRNAAATHNFSRTPAATASHFTNRAPATSRSFNRASTPHFTNRAPATSRSFNRASTPHFTNRAPATSRSFNRMPAQQPRFNPGFNRMPAQQPRFNPGFNRMPAQQPRFNPGFNRMPAQQPRFNPAPSFQRPMARPPVFNQPRMSAPQMQAPRMPMSAPRMSAPPMQAPRMPMSAPRMNVPSMPRPSMPGRRP